MCGISGIFSLTGEYIPEIENYIGVMIGLQNHRGPDGNDFWLNKKNNSVALGHNRLAIIDLDGGMQPMERDGHVIVYNGEIYNYLKLKSELNSIINFNTKSDTEVILNNYIMNGLKSLSDLKGMFSFCIYDNNENEILLVRDRVGIKPLYYMVQKDIFYFASEVKALLPFVDKIETDYDALQDYLNFQFLFGNKTLFKGIYQLEPGHYLSTKKGKIEVQKYWDVSYSIDFNTPESEFHRQVKTLFNNSIEEHLVSDVPLGSYLSGGLDSSLVTAEASKLKGNSIICFTGKYTDYEGYDETFYAKKLVEQNNLELIEINITPQDFVENISKVIYHLDYPVAGPGSFGQYIVAKEASKYRKTILGGQGGDEIFGGYARYMIAYIEQAFLGELEGTSNRGKYVLTLEKSLRNLNSLKSYKPLIKSFWSEGLFDKLDSRYLRLIGKGDKIYKYLKPLSINTEYSSVESYYDLFNSNNFHQESYLDKMTHFDFKTLLPALLHVEDRMSMANGIESRVPFLDHELIELAAKIPADLKFKDGKLKEILKLSLGDILPKEIIIRKDKMGFPIPLSQWFKTDLKEFIVLLFDSEESRNRNFFENDRIIDSIKDQEDFSRDFWALLSLELWFREFHDKEYCYKSLLNS
jgi:asparagine synthase (glutamine-hydrolysing)